MLAFRSVEKKDLLVFAIVYFLFGLYRLVAMVTQASCAIALAVVRP